MQLIVILTANPESVSRMTFSILKTKVSANGFSLVRSLPNYLRVECKA